MLTRFQEWSNYFLDRFQRVALRPVIERLDKIMSKISEFAAAMQEHLSDVDTHVTGLQGDIATLNDKITELQNSAGTLTPEDQATLDAIQAKAKDVADKLHALDELTPPAPPPA